MQKPKLLDRVVQVMRVHHYSIRTERTYIQWIKRYIWFHKKRHPADMGEPEVRAFLTWLAVDKHVSASTQNQALSAILFLYKKVLMKELDWIDDVVRAKRPKHLPVVLTRDEVRRLLEAMNGNSGLVARLLYGTGMRLMEAARLRILDVDFAGLSITVRHGKGGKDRITTLPESIVSDLQRQVRHARDVHKADLADGYGRTYLPFALDRKYPSAGTDPKWQYVFPSMRRSKVPGTDQISRHHMDEKSIGRSIRNAARRVGIMKHITSHTLRHSFATHLIENVTTSARFRNYWGTRT